MPALLRKPASKYQVLYSYAAKIGSPVSQLIAVDGTFYGLSYTGGSKKSGLFYRLGQAGEVTVLHAFKTYPEKDGPGVSGVPSSLVLLDGTFYATAVVRKNGGGLVTAFLQIDKSGAVRIVRSFPNGLGPLMVAANGQLYGVGSAYSPSHGTVFSITRTGIYHILYSFRGGNDGDGPDALLFRAGVFYGTTAGGGAHGTGTVFAMTTTGSKRTIYSFAGGSDGADPTGNVIMLGGSLYGTTMYGGKTVCPGNDNSGPPLPPFNCGTVYAVTLSGAERVLHSFNFGDGAQPAGLTNGSGTLYGVTMGDEYALTVGSSTVYSVSTAGEFHVLHHFGKGGYDAWWGDPGLTFVSGYLFGTATGGDDPNGVAFRYRLP